MLAYMDSSWEFLVAAIFVGSGYGTLTTSMQSQAVQSTSVARSGYATATYFTLFDTGIAIGSYILGLIAMSFSYQAVYVLCGVLLAVNMIIYILQFSKKPSAS